MENPLVASNELPPFNEMLPEHVVPAVSALIKSAERVIEHLKAQPEKEVSWEQFAMPLDEACDRLNQAWSPVSHLNAVLSTAELRQAYNEALPLLTRFYSQLGQDVSLYRHYAQLAQDTTLDGPQQQAVKNSVRDFQLSGAELDEDKKKRFQAIQEELSALGATFDEHLIDATDAWFYHTEDEEALDGLTAHGLQLAKQQAEEKGVAGYVISLDFSSYYSGMQSLNDRALRKKLYEAYQTRASDQGPCAGQFDNGPVMESILALRFEKAALLGYGDYTCYALEKRMVNQAQDVSSFLLDLLQRARPQAKKEYEALCAFAQQQGHEGTLEAWDVAYYSEKMKESLFQISDEVLREYFPADQVLNGLFSVLYRLFEIEIERVSGVSVWHKDVVFYEVKRHGKKQGALYLDLYARTAKRGGAWMDECRLRRRCMDGHIQDPVAYVVCNFTPPVGQTPALLTHEEVETLFHEFGHALHHVLTRIEVSDVSGINGVPWDAVELPSQFLEHWCWQREALDLFARHYQTGERLPDDLYEKMWQAKNFQSALQLIRQLEFSLFDIQLHTDAPSPGSISSILAAVREKVNVIPVPSFNRFQHSFSHIFSGGYAAGYYSYLWAEVLSSDAFSRFEEEGVFNAKAGHDFYENILTKGGSKEPMALFKAFRGRPPEMQALLRQRGILDQK